MDKRDHRHGTGIVNRAGSFALLLAGAALACQPRAVARDSTSTATSGAPYEASAAIVPVRDPTSATVSEQERLVYEARSQYSQLQVIDEGRTRALLFVHDDGEKVVQSRMRLDAPALLDVPYTRVMFASLLFRREQQRCMIVGLGGGSMVRFLRQFFPEIAIDVVEVDPLVVQVAADYFGVQSNERVRIITADAYDFVKETEERYDVIYLDAFLKVSSETDSTGVPLDLRTAEFLGSVRARLGPEGLLVSNIHQRLSTPGDVAMLGTGFPTVYVFPVPDTGNTVVLSSLATRRLSRTELRWRGRLLDRHTGYGFSFEDFATMLAP